MARIIDLDGNATTKAHPAVIARMIHSLEAEWGNPSSTNSLGETARHTVEDSRTAFAVLLGAEPSDIVFTSGATESINLAIQSVVKTHAPARAHVVTSRLEHSAVRATLLSLQQQSRIDLTILPNDEYGRVHPRDVEKALRINTLLVCLNHGNNEIGTVNPIHAIGEILRHHSAYFMVDAAQTLGWCPPSMSESAIDLLAGSAHKMHGPKGVGILYVREGTPFRCILYGGDQERGRRPGTPNTVAIAGAGVAAQLASQESLFRAERVGKLRDRLLFRLREGIELLELNGHPTERLPNNLSLTLPYVPAESLIREVYDRIAISRGSACTSKSGNPSHILKAIGLTGERLQHWTIRIGLSALTTSEEIEEVADLMIEKIVKLQRLAVT